MWRDYYSDFDFQGPYLCDAMSADGPFTEDMQSVLLRSRTFNDRRCLNIQISPLPCRRTSSVVSEFIPLTPFRSRSARPNTVATPPCSAPTMQHHPRTNHCHNTGVARFFDWSEQEKEECVSVSRLYRELAVGAGASVPRSFSEKVRPRGGGAPNAPVGAWGGAGGVSPRVNPGRMFLRDKGMLTKGEREIIEGIYRNRGDMSKREPAQVVKSEFVVRSHHDAWLVGKSSAPNNKPSTEIPREAPPNGSLMEVMAPGGHLNCDYSSTSSPRVPAATAAVAADGQGHHQIQGRATCALCLREQQQLHQHQQQQHQHHHHHHQQPLKQHGVHQTAAQGRHRNSLPHSLPQGTMLRAKNIHEGFRQKGGGGGREDVAPMAPPTTPSFMGPTSVGVGMYDFKTSSYTSVGSNAGLSSNSSPTPNTAHTNVVNNSPSNKLLFRRRGVETSLTARYDPGLTAAINQSPVFRFDHDQPGNSPTYENDHSGGGRGAYGGGGWEGEGGELWSDGESSQDSEESRKKLQVKVYLPKMGAEPADEDAVKASHSDLSGSTGEGDSRPVLARRERPLSHSDLKHGERHPSEPKEGEAGEDEGDESHRIRHANGEHSDIKTDRDDRHYDDSELGGQGINGRTTLPMSRDIASNDDDKQRKHERIGEGAAHAEENEKKKKGAINATADSGTSSNRQKTGDESSSAQHKSASRQNHHLHQHHHNQHHHHHRISNNVRRKHSIEGGGNKGDVSNGPSSSSSSTCWLETDSNHGRDSPGKRPHGILHTVTVLKAESDGRMLDE